MAQNKRGREVWHMSHMGISLKAATWLLLRRGKMVLSIRVVQVAGFKEISQKPLNSLTTAKFDYKSKFLLAAVFANLQQ